MLGRSEVNWSTVEDDVRGLMVRLTMAGHRPVRRHEFRAYIACSRCPSWWDEHCVRLRVDEICPCN